MTTTLRSLSLNDLSWVEVRDHLTRDTRLLVPVGACDQYGPHLPIGSTTLVAEAVASVLSRDFGVLRAPAVPYGVNLPSARGFPGAAALQEKTLHRVLNDLLACWETQGFKEFILLTAHSHDPHVEAIASVAIRTGRIRVIELMGIDVSSHLDRDRGPTHGGEALTSLMLYLHPRKVNLAAARDSAPTRGGKGLPRRLGKLPAGSAGAVGFPSSASAEKGEKIFEQMVERIRAKVFLQPEPEPA